MKIRTACPGCSTRYVLPSEGIPPEGRRVACRHCGQQWVIPCPGRQSTPATATPAGAAGPAPPPTGGEGVARVVACPHCDFHYLSAAAKPIRTDRAVILVAEDQAFFRTIIREALGEGYRYVVAASVGEARQVLQLVKVDLMILDLNLEEAGDGEKILDFVQAGTPTLVLTGDTDPDLYGDRWRELQEKGATDLLMKGLNIRDQLAIKVGSLLEQSRAGA